MRRWAAFTENGFLFEAFLPESEDESQVWTVRISRDTEVHMRPLRLTWPPQFGPDAGDIAALERFSEQEAAALAARGDVTVTPSEAVPPMPDTGTLPIDLMTGAIAFQLLQGFDDVMEAWAMTDDERRRWLARRSDQPIRRLFAWAITADDRERLRQTLMLHSLLMKHFRSIDATAQWLRTPRLERAAVDELERSEALTRLLREFDGSDGVP